MSSPLIVLAVFSSGPMHTVMLLFSVCPTDYFGSLCTNRCQCTNNVECDVDNGSCKSAGCRPGLIGAACDLRGRHSKKTVKTVLNAFVDSGCLNRNINSITNQNVQQINVPDRIRKISKTIV